jgi:hypothetical protein
MQPINPKILSKAFSAILTGRKPEDVLEQLAIPATAAPKPAWSTSYEKEQWDERVGVVLTLAAISAAQQLDAIRLLLEGIRRQITGIDQDDAEKEEGINPLYLERVYRSFFAKDQTPAQIAEFQAIYDAEFPGLRNAGDALPLAAISIAEQLEGIRFELDALQAAAVTETPEEGAN